MTAPFCNIETQYVKVDTIKKIHAEKYNCQVLPQRQLSQNLIYSITKHYNDTVLFTRNNKRSYCTQSYIQEVILKYCQHRTKYKKLTKLTK